MIFFPKGVFCFIFGAKQHRKLTEGEFQKGRVPRMAFFQRQTAAGEISGCFQK